MVWRSHLPFSMSRGNISAALLQPRSGGKTCDARVNANAQISSPACGSRPLHTCIIPLLNRCDRPGTGPASFARFRLISQPTSAGLTKQLLRLTCFSGEPTNASSTLPATLQLSTIAPRFKSAKPFFQAYHIYSAVLTSSFNIRHSNYQA